MLLNPSARSLVKFSSAASQSYLEIGKFIHLRRLAASSLQYHHKTLASHHSRQFNNSSHLRSEPILETPEFIQNYKRSCTLHIRSRLFSLELIHHSTISFSYTWDWSTVSKATRWRCSITWLPRLKVGRVEKTQLCSTSEQRTTLLYSNNLHCQVIRWHPKWSA